ATVTTLGVLNAYAARDTDALLLVLAGEKIESLSGTTLGGDRSDSCQFVRLRLVAKRGLADAANVSAALPVGTSTEAEAAAKKAAKTGEEEETESPKLRMLRVHAGFSWVSRDKEPVFSLSMGWEGVARSGWGGE